ncbi:MAG: glycogen/starch synthase, partial [Elusimicrobiota bacterium]
PPPTLPSTEPGSVSLKSSSDESWSRLIGEESRPLNILLAGSESVPYIKTGGLADVMDALSRGFAGKGHKVKMFLPKYPEIDAAKHGLKPVPGSFQVPVAGRQEPVTLWHAERGGADIYLIDNPNVYSRDGPYARLSPGYDDTDERFIFFSRAALEAARFIGFSPDVVHTHDWHTGLMPALLKTVYASDPFFSKAVSLQTIHNIAYQGIFGFESLIKAGLDPKDFNHHKFEYHGKFSLLKSGLVSADAVSTVSPTYAAQIQYSSEFGMGLEGLLRYRAADVHGILNGLDPQLWDPRTDQNLAANYGTEDAAAGKAANKAALQAEHGLAQDPKAPVFGVAARLDRQKGLDLIADVVPLLVQLGGQLVIAGSGDPELKTRFEELTARYPKNVFLHPFSESFARQVFAASDFLLMPSRFEPCGLSQLIAHRYGSLPIATRTGGLSDTIKDVAEHPGKGDGIFLGDFSVQALTESLARAFVLHYKADGVLAQARARAMANDSSWGPALDNYIALFRDLLSRRG